MRSELYSEKSIPVRAPAFRRGRALEISFVAALLIGAGQLSWAGMPEQSPPPGQVRALSPAGPGALRQEAQRQLAKLGGPAGRLRYTDAGTLALATHLQLELPEMSPTTPPDILVDVLLERFSPLLPLPEPGLLAHTRVWPLGPVEVIQRTWSWGQLPLAGRVLTLHRLPSGRVTLISARGFPTIAPPHGLESARPGTFPTPRWCTLEHARARAQEAFANLLRLEPRGLEVYPVLEPGPTGMRPVWWAELRPEAPLLPLGLRLQGETGAPLGLRLLAATGSQLERQAVARTAYGDVYPDSALDGATEEGTLPNLIDPLYLTGSWVTVYNYQLPGTQVQTAVPTSSDDLHYDYPPTEVYSGGVPTEETQRDLFAEVMMYYHVNQAHDYFNTIGYHNDDPNTGIDRSMDATVNYRARSGTYNNAFYSLGNSSGTVGEMVFGQGEATDFTYDSSVIIHEYGHAVVNGTSNYSLGCTPDLYGTDCTEGGLNEGSADYFSGSLRNDPEIGAYAIGEWYPEYIRNLRDPNRCPDDLYGEVHEDGRIWGAGLWDVRETLSNGHVPTVLTRVDPLIMATIATTLPEASGGESALSYAADILESVVHAAVEEQELTTAEEQKVLAALDARGLRSCLRFVPLSPGQTRPGAFTSSSLPLPSSTAAAGLQYTVEVPEGALKLSFEVGGLTEATLYANRGRPVEYDVSTGVPTADQSVTGTRLELTPDTGLEAGTWYITFTSRQTLATALYGYYYDVRADVARPLDTGSDPGGCHCGGTESTQALGGLSSLGVTLLVFVRRRKRERSR